MKSYAVKDILQLVYFVTSFDMYATEPQYNDICVPQIDLGNFPISQRISNIDKFCEG